MDGDLGYRRARLVRTERVILRVRVIDERHRWVVAQ
jgi:hypothetical protein